MTDAVDRLRTIASALPDVAEKLSHGEVSFFCRRQFVMLDDHHHGADHLAFWAAAPAGAQEELVASNPERYFRPPYVGHRGWLGVYLDVPVDWDELERLVADAHAVVASRR